MECKCPRDGWQMVGGSVFMFFDLRKDFVGCRSWIVQQISMISISSFCHLFRHCHNFSFTRTLWLNAYFPVCTWVLHSLWNRFLGNSLGTRRAFPTTIGKQIMCILDMFLWNLFCCEVEVLESCEDFCGSSLVWIELFGFSLIFAFVLAIQFGCIVVTWFTRGISAVS